MSTKNNYYNILSSGSHVPENNSIKNLYDEKAYKIFIDNLIVQAFIGIHQHEKDSCQKLSINIELTVPDNLKNIKDNINNVVSYEKIVGDIKAIFKKGHIELLETLSEEIAEVCLKDKRVVDAKIRINKLEVFPETDCVGIQTFRKQKKSKLISEKKVLKLKE